MEANQELFDRLFRDQVLQARSMTSEERVREGFRLSELALRVMADGVRHQFPNATDDEVEQLVCERVNCARRLENLR